ncbi:MAG TPA: hypothetical protein VK616_12440 [Flavitalea sp.]|nr:hypothetical protein [Flavitalea sp.]
MKILSQEHLTARVYDSAFTHAHDTYNAISAASNGQIFYVLSSESVDEGGKIYVFDPKDDKVRLLGDLTEICGEQHSAAVPQGKSHTRFYEKNGKLYFSTHVGYYELIDGMESLPRRLPNGIKPYPGGHILSYDLKSGIFEDLATVPGGEGVLSMTMDKDRGQIYGITWPTGRFIHFDIETRRLKHYDPVSGKGEAGEPGNDFRSLCRSLVVDPRDGTVYFSTSEGNIFCFNPEKNHLKKMDGIDLKLDYFGTYDPNQPGSMAYNWRKIFWHPSEHVAYGVHGNSGYLFRFDPLRPAIELIERISSELSKKSGMFDQFSYGYLGFQLGPDGNTIYYLTGGPVYLNGKRVKGEGEIAKGGAKAVENLHLVTYDLEKGIYTDHGPVYYTNGERPLYVNSIAIGADGVIYTLARVTRSNKTLTDLISIPNPLSDE